MIATADQLREVMDIPFSDEQIAAITAPLEPTVIIAGAGTGKTTVMAARVVWCVGTGAVRPEEVLGLTFTRKAAGELADRIRDSLLRAGLVEEQEDEAREQVSTYDAFAARLLDEQGLRAGVDVQPRLVQGAMRHQLMERVVRAAQGPLDALADYALPTLIERALKLDGELQSNLVDIHTARRFTEHARDEFLHAPGYGKGGARRYKDMLDAARVCEQRLELLQLVADYQQLKRRLGVVEYADQLRSAAELASAYPEVGAQLRARYRLVLLDEYQDTSSAQATLLQALFDGHAVTGVGDPYQAIYGWRGAAATNILHFDEAFGEASRLGLGINRRSLPRILAVGNALASTVPGDGVRLVAPEGTSGGVIEYWAQETADGELAAIADDIVALEGQCRWKDVAVLCRRNETLAPLHLMLRDRGVPVEIVGVGGLLALPEVAPVLATLRLLADPLDNPSLTLLLSSARWALPLDDLQRLGRRARQLRADDEEPACLLEAVASPPTLSPAGRGVVEAFDDWLRQLRTHATDPVAELVARVIRSLGIEEELLARGRSTAQLAAFVDVCAGHSSPEGAVTLPALLSYLAAEERDGVGLEQAVVSEEDSVKLLTVHRAKGLEWEHVYLPCLVEGVFPSKPRGGNWLRDASLLPAPLRGDANGIPQLAEYSKQAASEYAVELAEEHGFAEDRLAYVAATRARSRLVGSHHRWTPGVKGERRRSRYGDVIAHEAAASGDVIDRTSGAEENPLLDRSPVVAWPARVSDDDLGRVRQAAELVHAARDDDWVLQSGSLPPEVARQFALWDDSMAHVLSQRDRYTIQLPRGLSATQLIAYQHDPDDFAQQLARRMPRRPSRGATVGSAFHEWLQRRFESAAFDEFERVPAEIASLVQRFECGQFRDRTPIAVEVPFAMAAGSFQIRGRIDAVFAWEGAHDEVVVDWKTSDQDADPLQLEVYRRAWAEARGLAPERVGAAFYHVPSDRLVFAAAQPGSIEQVLKIEEG